MSGLDQPYLVQENTQKRTRIITGFFCETVHLTAAVLVKKREGQGKKEKGEHLLAISSNRSSWVWELDTDVAVADGGETNLDRKWIAF